jgi:hypothetical protein
MNEDRETTVFAIFSRKNKPDTFYFSLLFRDLVLNLLFELGPKSIDLFLASPLESDQQAHWFDLSDPSNKIQSALRHQDDPAKPHYRYRLYKPRRPGQQDTLPVGLSAGTV